MLADFLRGTRGERRVLRVRFDRKRRRLLPAKLDVNFFAGSVQGFVANLGLPKSPGRTVAGKIVFGHAGGQHQFLRTSLDPGLPVFDLRPDTCGPVGLSGFRPRFFFVTAMA